MRWTQDIVAVLYSLAWRCGKQAKELVKTPACIHYQSSLGFLLLEVYGA